MQHVKVLGGWPPARDLLAALDVAANELDTYTCYRHLGRYHFPLGGGWSVALSPESAGRIRVETCRLTRPMNSMWALGDRADRLAGLVRRMAAEARQTA